MNEREKLATAVELDQEALMIRVLESKNIVIADHTKPVEQAIARSPQTRAWNQRERSQSVENMMRISAEIRKTLNIVITP